MRFLKWVTLLAFILALASPLAAREPETIYWCLPFAVCTYLWLLAFGLGALRSIWRSVWRNLGRGLREG